MINIFYKIRFEKYKLFFQITLYFPNQVLFNYIIKVFIPPSAAYSSYNVSERLLNSFN